MIRLQLVSVLFETINARGVGAVNGKAILKQVVLSIHNRFSLKRIPHLKCIESTATSEEPTIQVRTILIICYLSQKRFEGDLLSATQYFVLTCILIGTVLKFQIALTVQEMSHKLQTLKKFAKSLQKELVGHFLRAQNNINIWSIKNNISKSVNFGTQGLDYFLRGNIFNAISKTTWRKKMQVLFFKAKNNYC